MSIIQIILGLLALSSVLATIVASFYGVRQTTIIKTLKESNAAYAENNRLLTEQLKKERIDFNRRIAALEGKTSVLEKLKTPPLQPLIALVVNNHKEVMKALNGKAVASNESS